MSQLILWADVNGWRLWPSSSTWTLQHFMDKLNWFSSPTNRFSIVYYRRWRHCSHLTCRPSCRRTLTLTLTLTVVYYSRFIREFLSDTFKYAVSQYYIGRSMGHETPPPASPPHALFQLHTPIHSSADLCVVLSWCLHFSRQVAGY